MFFFMLKGKRKLRDFHTRFVFESKMNRAKKSCMTDILENASKHYEDSFAFLLSANEKLRSCFS